MAVLGLPRAPCMQQTNVKVTKQAQAKMRGLASLMSLMNPSGCFVSVFIAFSF